MLSFNQINGRDSPARLNAPMKVRGTAPGNMT